MTTKVTDELIDPAPVRSVLDLTDVLNTTFVGSAGLVLTVNEDETGVEFTTAGSATGATALTQLTDFPTSYVGQDGKRLVVDESNSKVVFETIPEPVVSFLDLTDTPSSYTGANGKFVSYASGTGKLVFVDSPIVDVAFTTLVDCPSSYTGKAGYSVQVNELGTGLEFVAPTAPVAISFLSLDEAPASIEAGKFLRGTSSGLLEFATAPGVTSFLGLGDTPSSYSGHNGKMVTVSGSSLTFTTVPTTYPTLESLTDVDPYSTGSAGDVLVMKSGGGGEWVDPSTIGGGSSAPAPIIVAVTSETSTVSTGSAKVTFRAPAELTLSSVRASLTTASSSGAVQVNVRVNGTTIFSTPLTIDASEKTSLTAASAAVLSTTAIADDAEIKIDVDSAGSGAVGLKVTFILE